MSDTHFDALQRNLRAAHNTHQHAKPPANPVEFVRGASPDVLLSPTERARERAAETDRRLRAAASGERDDAGDTDDDDEDDEVMVDGEPYSRRDLQSGSSLSKSLTRGAFQALRNQVSRHFAHQGTGALMQSEEFDQRALMAKLKSEPITKTDTSGLRKSMAKVANALGNTTLAKSLEAGYGADSATLKGGSAVRKQSLDKRLQATVAGGDPQPRVYSPAEVSLAAQHALAHGQITVEQAGRIQSELDLYGKISPKSEALLKGDADKETPMVKSIGPRGAPRYSVEQLEAAASQALMAKAITPDQANRIATEITLGGASAESIALLRRAKPSQTSSRLLTKSECFGALSKALAAGQITGSQAMAAESCLNLDARIADGTMAVLRKVHFGM